MLGVKPTGVPMAQNHKLTRDIGEKLHDQEKYRRLVGRLIYLSITRPELAYCVHILVQFMIEPRLPHWDAELQVVRYLKERPRQGLFLSRDCDLSISAY